MSARTRSAQASLMLVILALWGCGGQSVDVGVGISNSSNGQLAGPTGAIGQELATYEILDVASGTTVTANAVPDLLSNHAYYTTKIVFRRVHGLQNDFFLSVFTISQGQWKNLASGGAPWTLIPSSVVPAPTAGVDPDSLPAYNISFGLISSTLNVYNLTAKPQLGFPSLKQWQFSCAAGTDPSFWSWGTSRDPAVSGLYANLLTTQMPQLNAGQLVGGPTPVGSFLPNAFGFYDMHGNVWEWVTPGPHICGGSWHDGIDQARTSNVAGSDTCLVTDQTTHALIGVRLVMVP